MPHDPILVDQTLIPKTGFGGHDSVVIRSYEAPAAADGGYTEDVYKAFDAHCCDGMMRILNQTYPAYVGFWAVRHDKKQQIAGISMPVLMGVNNWMVINLRTHELTPGLIIISGGEILERFNQSRVRFDLGTFLQAREDYGLLENPNRKVPN